MSLSIRKFSFTAVVGAAALCAFLLLVIENAAFLSPYAHMVGELNLAILLVFALDVLLRLFSSEDRRAHLKRNWFDWVVFIPLFQLIAGGGAAPSFVITRLTAIAAILISHSRHSSTFIDSLSKRPAQLMVITFGFAIGVGTVLLMLPAATLSGQRTSLADALFTATSATCVTGLSVQDTARYFSLFGQMVILALIQIGGLGIMTFSISLALLLKKRMEIRQEIAMQNILDQSDLSTVRKMILFIVKMTVVIEALGALVLAFAWRGRVGGFLQTVFAALFHSVSAFCNAGFSTFSDNLMGFQRDSVTTLTIGSLIIAGGLGFVVISDVFFVCKNRLRRGRGKREHLKVQSRVVLWASLILIAGGALGLFIAEKNLLLAGQGLRGRVLIPLFQSITARTAGFNTCDIGRLCPLSLLLIILLMFIGGSPSSTAGGVKTTTVTILWALLMSELRGRQHVEVFKRTIPSETVQKAAVILVFSLLLVSVFTGLLLFVEHKGFIEVFFETVSAFGTVGLSTGITPALTVPGKLLITVLMFIGRIGPLTIGYALFGSRRPAQYMYAQESVGIG